MEYTTTDVKQATTAYYITVIYANNIYGYNGVGVDMDVKHLFNLIRIILKAWSTPYAAAGYNELSLDFPLYSAHISRPY